MHRDRHSWQRASLVVGLAALLLAAITFPFGGATATSPGGSSFAVQKALAGDFSGAGAGDRKLLGLFSESVGGNLKAKIPSSEWGKVRNVRLFVAWRKIELKHKGDYVWGGLDAEVNNSLSLGVNSILMTLTGPVPIWATNRANPNPSYYGPPKNMQDWQDFCNAVATRYKGYVEFYQMWQEPGWDSDSGPGQTGKIYYSGQCDYSYMGLLRAGYNGVKAADPNAQVITGSLINGLDRTADNFKNYETLLAGGNQDISMKITSNQNIVAERPMYFNYHGSISDGTVELGTKEPKTVWFLAEGATHPGFEEYICIQNPGDTASDIWITYMFNGGATQNQGLTVAPHSRATVSVNSAVGPDKNVSAKVEASKPVVVERPMYFNYHGSWDGGSIGSGVPSLSKDWYLAEGATQPGFETWISLMNPGASATDVTLTYMFPGGKTQKQAVHMAPTSRETVLVNNAVGPNKDVSTQVHATNPIIAERPMYFLYHGAWSGGDSQVGATAPGTSWFLSEGTTRSNQVDGAFEEWISIQNPGDAAAKVDFTYMFPGGGTQKAERVIGAHSRETVLVNDVVGANKDVSVQLDSDNPIVVERPMYFSYHNKINGGDVELGCQSSAKTWYFAEGTTREGFEEWTTLQNPGASTASVTVTYMFGDGTTQDQKMDLPPKSRTTIGVNHSVSMATICDEVTIHPYDYPQWWAWYYANLANICNKWGYGGKEVSVTEIGWPHKYVDGFTPEGQRQAIGEVGVGGLWAAGCRKIWIYEDVDPSSAWDGAYDGLWSFTGSPWPSWNEYAKWQTYLQDYGNKPNHLW